MRLKNGLWQSDFSKKEIETIKKFRRITRAKQRAKKQNPEQKKEVLKNED